jgi:hypothetical protein
MDVANVVAEVAVVVVVDVDGVVVILHRINNNRSNRSC